jgi:hypothetical protein
MPSKRSQSDLTDELIAIMIIELATVSERNVDVLVRPAGPRVARRAAFDAVNLIVTNTTAASALAQRPPVVWKHMWAMRGMRGSELLVTALTYRNNIRHERLASGSNA